MGGTKNAKHTLRGVLAAFVVVLAALGSRAEEGPATSPGVPREATGSPADQALDQLQERIITVSEAVKPRSFTSKRS